MGPDFPTIFANEPDILAAYLFGSIAHEVAGPTSDVDVAVRLIKGLSAERRFDIRLEIMDDVEKFFNRSADIVILNDASLTMIRQILNGGKLLYARNEEAEYSFAIQKQKEYFDFKYYMEKNRKALKSYFGVA